MPDPNTCNNCKSQISYLEIRYHCTVCDDFDLCVNCKKDGHPHPMDKLGFALDNGSSLTAGQRCLQSLKHAQACKDAECNLPKSISWRCPKMKLVLKHANRCRRIRRNVYNCLMCKPLIDLVFDNITLSIQLPRQVRDEAATIAVTMTITTGATAQSAGQSADKQFAVSKPEYQQLMQIIDADTPDRQKKIFQILKCNSSFIAAFSIVEYLQQFGQHGGRVGGPLGPNQPQQQPE